ncbi:MAG: O-antigen ligase family protein [Flavobacteriaceae bacterium]|nr:O-antigen ligase family protein [Flavobacteriaceae bacterium]
MLKKAGNYQLFILAIPILIYIFGLINSDNLDYGVKFISRNLSLIAFPIIFFSNNKNTYIKTDSLLKVFLTSIFILNIYLIYLFIYYFNLGEKLSIIITELIYHSTYLGLYNIVAAWVCFFIYRNSKNKKFILFYLFFIFSAIITSSRIIFILGFFSLIIVTLSYIKKPIINFFLVAIILFLTSVVIIKTPSLNEKFSQLTSVKKLSFDKNNYQSISSRFGKIEASLKLIKKNILFGVGTGDLKDDLAIEYKKMRFVMGYKYRYNSHNQYLDSIARNGLIGGGIVLLCIFIFPLFIAIKYKRGLLLFVLLSVMFVCFTESVFGLQKGVTFYTFIVTLLIFETYQTLNSKSIT